MRVKIPKYNIHEGEYEAYGKTYNVLDIIEMAKNLPEFEMPLQGIDIGVCPWVKKMDIKSFIYHVQRMNDAEMEHPIILDTTGYPCDGWHRIAKAMLMNKSTIRAKRLEVMPEPLEKDD